MDISVEHGCDYYDYDFCLWYIYDFELKGLTVSQFIINMFLHYCKSLCVPKEHPSAALELVSEPNPLRPLRDLQYGPGEMVFGGCRHLEYMNIWCFNEPK